MSWHGRQDHDPIDAKILAAAIAGPWRVLSGWRHRPAAKPAIPACRTIACFTSAALLNHWRLKGQLSPSVTAGLLAAFGVSAAHGKAAFLAFGQALQARQA